MNNVIVSGTRELLLDRIDSLRELIEHPDTDSLDYISSEMKKIHEDMQAVIVDSRNGLHNEVHNVDEDV
jgi:hypothetical protein